MKSIVAVLLAGLATLSTHAAEPPVTPSPAYKALIGTELETVVRHHAILIALCKDHSLDEPLQSKTMRLHVQLLGESLKDVRNSEELTWLTNAYFNAYGDGVASIATLLEKKQPGFKDSLCAVTIKSAKSLVVK